MRHEGEIMYTVIVADDEEEIRKGIVRKVKWNEIGFQVIGEAENGIEALELVEKLEPDLLLTDIRMPFLSGIELARQVREVRPTVQIAFLSGFDEFRYAQQAIQYNIISYMLKPISSRQLEEELGKIKKIMDRKFEEFSSKTLVQERMEKSEFMLTLLLDGLREGLSEQDKQQFMQNAVSCGLLRTAKSEQMNYVVMMTSISEGEEGRTTRASVNAVDMILKKYVRSVSCYLKGRVVSIMAATPTGFQKYLHIIVDEIVQSVERIMHLNCTVGISRSTNVLMNCRECYLEAMNALSYSSQKESDVYFIADEERTVNVNRELMESTVNTMEGLLRGGSNEELKGFLHTFSEQISEGKIAPALADFMMSQVLADIFKVVYSVAGEEPVKQLQSEYCLKNRNTVGQVMEEFERYASICLAAKELISEQRKKSGEILCDKALEIIRTRYKEQELSVAKVSEEIAVSPNYLSTLIKKTTGSTFVELLTQKRMDKAKELLLCTSIKIWEIAEECGYRDQHYFSYCFKKAMGISPNQCRRENGQ